MNSTSSIVLEREYFLDRSMNFEIITFNCKQIEFQKLHWCFTANFGSYVDFSEIQRDTVSPNFTF